MDWQTHIDRPGIWLARRGAGTSAKTRQPDGFAVYDTLVVVAIGEQRQVVNGNVVGALSSPVRFMRLLDATWTKLEHLPYPPEAVYAFIETLNDSAEVAGWDLRDRVEGRPVR